MSDLEALEEVFEQRAGKGGIRMGGCRQPECRNGHERTPENTKAYKRGAYIQLTCLDCRRNRPVRYSAREYPL